MLHRSASGGVARRCVSIKLGRLEDRQYMVVEEGNE